MSIVETDVKIIGLAQYLGLRKSIQFLFDQADIQATTYSAGQMRRDASK